MYDSEEPGELFQKKPPFRTASLYKPKGWTETVEGYINEAKQLAMCILHNEKAMRRSYTWAVHINMNVAMTPDQITSQWAKTCRTLRRRGIVALWVRERLYGNKSRYKSMNCSN